MKNVFSAVPKTLSLGENTVTNHCEIAVFNNYLAFVADTAKQNINKYLKNLCIKEFKIFWLKTISCMICSWVSDRNFLLPTPQLI